MTGLQKSAAEGYMRRARSSRSSACGPVAGRHAEYAALHRDVHTASVPSPPSPSPAHEPLLQAFSGSNRRLGG